MTFKNRGWNLEQALVYIYFCKHPFKLWPVKEKKFTINCTLAVGKKNK